MPASRKLLARAARSRLACGVFGFLLTALVGGLAGAVLISEFQRAVEETARRDANVIGSSVARSLASQFERAVRFGIPLKLLPGVDTYLADTLAQTPGLARVVLRGPDGRELRAAIGALPARSVSSAPILLDGIQMGVVEVAASPANLSQSLPGLTRDTALAVLGCALVAGVVSWLFAGRHIARREVALFKLLVQNAEGNPETGPSNNQLGRGVIDTAFRTLGQGVRRLAYLRSSFEGYAEEQLAVDFDGRLRSEIERVRREAIGPAPRPSRGA